MRRKNTSNIRLHFRALSLLDARLCYSSTRPLPLVERAGLPTVTGARASPIPKAKK